MNQLTNDQLSAAMAQLQQMCHDASHAAGWWHNPVTGLPFIPGDSTVFGLSWGDLPADTREIIVGYFPYVVATKVALIHSEVSEGLEAFRINAMDDKLTDRWGLEVELTDAMIRQFDLAGAMSRLAGFTSDGALEYELGIALLAKMDFNAVRPDHKGVARRKSGGKKF